MLYLLVLRIEIISSASNNKRLSNVYLIHHMIWFFYFMWGAIANLCPKFKGGLPKLQLKSGYARVIPSMYVWMQLFIRVLNSAMV